MKPELQIKALAELDNPSLLSNKNWMWVDSFRFYRRGSEGEYWTPPSYLTSYDAIIPLIQKQPLHIKYKIAKQFLGVFPCDDELNVIAFMNATPAELCEALLRATGKWIES